MYNKKKKYRQFVSYMGPNVKKCGYLAILFIFGGGGSWGTLTSNLGLPNFHGSKTSSQRRQMYNKNPGLPNFQGSKISLQSRLIYNKGKK